MKVLGIEPRDVYVLMEMSSEQITHLLDFLDRCTVDYDSEKEPKLKQAVSYVTNEFFSVLNQLSEDLKQGDK